MPLLPIDEAQPIQRQVLRGPYLAWLIVVNLSATLLAVLLFAWFRGFANWKEAANSALAAFVYANCIGGPAGVLLPLVADWIKRRPRPFNWLSLAAVLLAVTAAGCLVAGLVLVAIGRLPASELWQEYATSVKFASLISLAVGMGAFFYEAVRHQLEQTQLELKTRQLEEERARKLATEARLSSLESRIHPHFLFNTLNSIASLIPEDPRQAEALVEKLAALLRFSLDANQHGLVPLRQELKIVGDYLEIERARFGDRLRYTMDVPTELLETRVPPFSVQTLVENGVKHAVAVQRTGGSITVTGRGDGGRLRIEVSDDGPGFEESAIRPGRGLDTLRARLDALFGSAASVEILRRSGGCVVSLVLPAANGVGAVPDRPAGRVQV